MAGTTYTEISKSITAKFAAMSLSALKYYENIPWDMDGITGPWVRLAILHRGGRHNGTGSGPIFLYPGNIVFDIFIPENTGTGDVDTIADELRAEFRAAQFDCINCDVDELHRVGLSNGFYHWQLTIPFKVYEIP